MKKIIYDVGANNGDDIPYYLKKADTVVALEANPSLCQEIRGRFGAEIAAGRLFVENCVVAADDSEKEVCFYIHQKNSVLSQFPKPGPEVIAEFKEFLLPSQSIVSIVQKYGEAYYMKIDIENYDKNILRAIFSAGIRPTYISAESNEIDVFALLQALGGYQSFNLVDSPNVARDYANHPILVNGQKEGYSFPYHSAGPFGDDLVTPWMTANNFVSFLSLEGLGWKDIHATNMIAPDPAAVHPPLSAYVSKAIKQRFARVFRRVIRR